MYAVVTACHDPQEGKIYSFEELSDSSAALLSQRHSEMRDVGKEIGKLLSSSNRILKVTWPADLRTGCAYCGTHATCSHHAVGHVSLAVLNWQESHLC
jgi:hypothetical protein